MNSIIKTIAFLVYLLALLFGNQLTIYAQKNSLRGEVRLYESNKTEKHESRIQVCIIRPMVYAGGALLCKKKALTDEQGIFTVQDLPPEPFLFLVLNPPNGYTQKPTPLLPFTLTDAKDGVLAPPPAVRLVQDPLKGRNQNARKTEKEPIVTSREAESGAASINIVLTLYAEESQQNGPAGSIQESSENNEEERQDNRPITLTGKVVAAHAGELEGANVFISKFDLGTQSVVVAKARSNRQGDFRIAVPERSEGVAYVFSVKAEGFQPFIASLSGLLEESRQSATLGSERSSALINHIELTRLNELYETGESLIETVEATRRHVYAPEVMRTLPLMGTRSFDQFALLAPGVAPPPETFGGVGPGVSPGVGTAGQFAVNGLRSRENNFTIDGSDNNDEDIGTRRQGFIMTVPQPVESVQELQVITALGDARFGRNIGGQINALTKTGGSGRFHGSLYGYFTNNWLNARDPFDQQTGAAASPFPLRRSSDGAPVLLDGTPLLRKSQVGSEDPFRRLQLGLAVGGQLSRDNDTSYFISAEQQDVRANKEFHFAVPTVRQRGAFASGDTGLLINGVTPIYPASVPGNAIFSLFPFPNNPIGPYGENTYSNVLPADGRGTRFSVKLGREFRGEAPKGKWWKTIFKKAQVDQISGRYNFTDEVSTLPVTGGALYSSLRPKVRTQNLAGYINRSLSTSTSDTIRISFGRTRLFFGERRDASQLASSALPDTPFLLNAPLLLNVTKPNANGTLNTPSFLSSTAPAGSALLGSLGYQGVTQTEQITGPLGQVIVAGFSPIGVDVENFPQSRANNTYQIADTITSIYKSHIFTLGVDLRKTRIDSTLDRNFRPRATFNGLSNAPFADIIERPGNGQVQAGPLTGATLAAAGVPTGLFQVLSAVPDSSIGLHYSQLNLFFQDQWLMRPRFYLTAGVRYELNTSPDTVGRRLEGAFDLQELRTLAEHAAQFCQPNARCTDLVGALTSAFPANFKVSFNADHNDFDVRLGAAWTPAKLRNTAIRLGFGTYSGQFPGIVIDQGRNAFPNFLPLNLANFTPRSGDQTFLFNLASPAVQQLLPSPGGVPAGIQPGTINQLRTSNPVAFLVNQIFNLQNLSLAPTAFGLDLLLPQPELKPPYAYHYGLTIERQFRRDYMISAAYVGTRALGLLRVATPDLGLNDSRFGGNVMLSPLKASEPFPYFQGQLRPAQPSLISQSFAIARTFFESRSQSTYHSLQVEFRKRYSNAFLVGSALTYSHAMDDASDFFDNAGAFALPQNSVVRSERGSSNFDVRVRSATHFVLDIQREWFGKKEWTGKKVWLGRILGGFQLAGIFTAQGGQPYTVNSAFDVNRDGNLTDRLNTVDGILHNSTGGRVQLTLAPGVNTRDLLAPDGTNGSVGRNTFRAPSVYNIDFSATQTIALREHRRFVTRVEFLNLFNWANYGIPVRVLESPGFGTSITTLTPQRTIQIVGKFQF